MVENLHKQLFTQTKITFELRILPSSLPKFWSVHHQPQFIWSWGSNPGFQGIPSPTEQNSRLPNEVL